MTPKFTKQFQRDYDRAKHSHLSEKINILIRIVSDNPFQNPPPYEKLRGYEHTYSRRINEQHRLVYVVEGNEIAFLSCWGHYE